MKQTEKAEKLYRELTVKAPGNPALNEFRNHFQQ
jgi:hypothetical protein